MSYVTEQKLRDLFYEVEKIRKSQQGGLDLPPKWVLEAATKNMKNDRTWDSFLNVLCIYYDVPPVFARVNKRISAVAHYIEAINLIEAQEFGAEEYRRNTRRYLCRCMHEVATGKVERVENESSD